MNLSDMIRKRKSVRKYLPQPVDQKGIEQIEQFCAGVKPLYPDIRVRAEILDKEDVKCIFPWVPPQVLAIFSEETEGYLENVGFMFQQVDLYLQSMGLGSCWLGMGRLDSDAKSRQNDGLKFVIMLAFGYTQEQPRSDLSQFKRRALTDISDRPDERLESARLAPSSVNSQPWYFTHQIDVIHAYCVRQRGFMTKALGDMNRIDMGIALAHLYVSNPDTFTFFQSGKAGEVKNHAYIGSIKL